MSERVLMRDVTAAEQILIDMTRSTAALPQGMADTPRRWLSALDEMTAGYDVDVAELLGRTFDSEGYDQVVALANIPFVSLCEHHILPFAGTVGVAYLPAEEGPVVGLSKLARVVDAYARRFQLQERLTKQIADAIEQHLRPRGVAVIVQGQHLCMQIRGVAKAGAVMRTSMVRGVFMDKPQAREEVLRLLCP